MRIASSERDYYDSGQATDQDRDVVYVRHAQDVKLETVWPFPRLSVYYWYDNNDSLNLGISWHIIGFCGKIYPCLRLSLSKPYQSPPQELHHVYDLAHLDGFIKKHFKPFVFDEYASEAFVRRAVWPQSSRRKIFEEWFKHCEEAQSAYNHIFVAHHVPIFVAEAGQRGWHDSSVIHLNALLRPFEFQKVKPLPGCYQDLRMYYEGVLAHPNRPIPNVSDEDMASAKGFDKWSFRKEPKRRRKG